MDDFASRNCHRAVRRNVGQIDLGVGIRDQTTRNPDKRCDRCKNARKVFPARKAQSKSTTNDAEPNTCVERVYHDDLVRLPGELRES